MENTKTHYLLIGLLSALLVVSVGPARAATLADTLKEAFSNQDLDDVRDVLDDQPQSTDEVVRSLLQQTQKDMKAEPDFSEDMMALASQYAPKITPPSVPAICADLRRVVDGLGPDQIGTDLYTTVMTASQNFAKAPVVAASGKPNLCEEAFLKVANFDGAEALLAQLPVNRGGRVKVVTVENGTPRRPATTTTVLPCPDCHSPHDKPDCHGRRRHHHRPPPRCTTCVSVKVESSSSVRVVTK